MGTENRKGPLKDVKVLDFTIALAGVYVAWQFADMGAEVWKVERYGSGDQARTWDPFVNGLSTLIQHIIRISRALSWICLLRKANRSSTIW